MAFPLFSLRAGNHRPVCAGWLLIASFLAAPTSIGAAAADGEDLFQPETVVAVTRQQFEEVLEHHRGKVVLVNFWATWCIPCIQELPEIDELQHRYRDQGLQVVCVSFDEVESLEEKVRPFFVEKAPHLISYLQAEEDPFNFVAALEPEWVGTLPMTFILDRGGKVRKTITGRLTFRAFEDAILPLLAEESPE